MIIGLFVTNIQTKEITARLTKPLSTTKIKQFILELTKFPKDQSGCHNRELYKYTYLNTGDFLFVIMSSLLFNPVKASRILHMLSKSTTGDPIDILITIDNLIYDNNFVTPNLTLIKNMESQEEKVHDMMMHNKSLEVKHKISRQVSDFDKQLERIRDLELEIKNESSTSIKSVVKIHNPIKAVRTEISKMFSTPCKPISLCFREKLKLSIDKENSVRSGEVQGDMTLLVSDEKYRDIKILLKNTKELKFSPNLDKSTADKGILQTEKGFPVGKNVALCKWKSTKLTTLPITFTYWPSEVSPNRYQVMFEYTAEYNLENLRIFIPKSNLFEVNVEDGLDIKQTDTHIEWHVGDVRKDSSDTLEFTCTCDSPDNIFPVEVCFNAGFNLSNVSVTKVMLAESKVDEVEIKRVFEVDKFEIVSE